MTWDSTKTCDQGYSETTIADNTRETAILQVCPFEFLSTRTTTILESTSRVHRRMDCVSLSFTAGGSRTKSFLILQETCQQQQSRIQSKDPKQRHKEWQ